MNAEVSDQRTQKNSVSRPMAKNPQKKPCAAASEADTAPGMNAAQNHLKTLKMKSKLAVLLILVLAAMFRSHALRRGPGFGEGRTACHRGLRSASLSWRRVHFGRLAIINTVTMVTTGCRVSGFSPLAWGSSGRLVIGVWPVGGTSGTKGIGARKSASTAASITATATSAQASPADVGRGACSGITRSSRT